MLTGLAAAGIAMLFPRAPVRAQPQLKMA
jgi:hypothetical protein